MWMALTVTLGDSPVSLSPPCTRFRVGCVYYPNSHSRFQAPRSLVSILIIFGSVFLVFGSMKLNSLRTFVCIMPCLSSMLCSFPPICFSIPMFFCFRHSIV